MKRPELKVGDRVRFRSDGEIGELNRSQNLNTEIFHTVKKICTDGMVYHEGGGSYAQVQFDICNDLSDIQVGDKVERYWKHWKHKLTTDTVASVSENEFKLENCKKLGCKHSISKADGIHGNFPKGGDFWYVLRIVEKAKPKPLLAPEGSVEWALYQMMQGKKVCQKDSDFKRHYKNGNVCWLDRAGKERSLTTDLFLKNFADTSDWQIYAEKPLLAEAKVGDLVKRRDGHWAQIIETSGGVEFQPIEYLHNKRLIAVTINGSYTVYNDYMQDDIVEYQPIAPEGSAEWALQMWKLGNDIRNETGVVLMADYESEEIRVKHLVDVFPSGWEIYKEPEYKVGDWVEYRLDGDTYYGKICNIRGYVYYFSVTTEEIPKDQARAIMLESIIRKLDPSEVRVKITLEGQVTKPVDNAGGRFWLYYSTDEYVSIELDALSYKDRELVESLIKAQEEK